jgi:signal transduction histidine kinase
MSGSLTRWFWTRAGGRLPLATGALLSAGALLELVARTGVTEARRTTAAPGVLPHTISSSHGLQIGDTAVSAQGATVVYLLAVAATLTPSLLGAASAAVIVTAANICSLTLFHSVTIAGACAQVLVLYRYGSAGARRAAALLGLAFLVVALADVNPSGSEAGVLTMLLTALAPAAALAGFAQRARSETLAHSAAQESIASTLLEHTARGERARIARELHDVVAHHISMIAIQAETARVATPGMPETGARRLLEIGDTARGALTEMRRLLGVLREDAGEPSVPGRPAERPPAERQPQPGLDQLNDLLDGARSAAGTGVRLIVSGAPAALDPGVELAAYRIIQEALTNARRHAPGAAVDVELHYDAGALQLRIRDNGPGAAVSAPTAGHGLLGMRERAAAVGGRLRAGPADLGGYLVEATLPATTTDGLV